MKLDRNIGGVCAAIALSVFACGKPEPARDVQSAQAQLTSAEQNARASGIRLDQRLQSERAAAEKKSDDAVNSAVNSLAQANARLDMERKNVTESSKVQLGRLTNTADDLETRSGSLSTDKKAKFDALWPRYEAQQKDVTNQITDLGNAPTDAWTTTKNTLSESLDQLNKTVAKLGQLF